MPLLLRHALRSKHEHPTINTARENVQVPDAVIQPRAVCGYGDVWLNANEYPPPEFQPLPATLNCHPDAPKVVDCVPLRAMAA